MHNKSRATAPTVAPLQNAPFVQTARQQHSGSTDERQIETSADRAEISLFVSALFRHADAGTFVSLRTFGDGENKRAMLPPVAFRIPDDGNLDPLIDLAFKRAKWAAQDESAWVFCPPVATFCSASRAREQDLANGLALSVELDANPAEGRHKLEEVLGPATLVVESGGRAIDEDGDEAPKLHLHWRLNEPTRTADEHASLKRLRAMASRYAGADHSNIPAVHPIRWAGSVHRKGSPRRARIVAYNERHEIDLSDAIERLENLVTAPFVSSVSGEVSVFSDVDVDGSRRMQDLITQILSGDNYHEPLTALAMRYIIAGVAPGQAVEVLRGLMRSVPEDRRDLKDGAMVLGRWQERFKDIPRLVSTARAKLGQSKAWPDPDPLPNDVPPVPAFHSELLPAGLRGWVLDVADRMQTPPDYVAVAAIVAAASVLGRKIAIRPNQNDDWTEVANLWGCVVGSPGMMKTPAMSAALAPLRALEALANTENQAALRGYERELREFKARADAAGKRTKAALQQDPAASLYDLDVGVEPKAPAARRHIVMDTTYEKLGEILKDNPNGVLAFRDELLAMLKPLDRDENAPARGFYLSAWSGKDGHTFDRIGRGHIHIPAICLSVLGSTQPNKLGAHIRRTMHDGMNDDGLLQRFGMLVFPDTPPVWKHVDRGVDSEAKRRAEQIFEKLHKLTAAQAGADSEDASIPFLRFTQEAQYVFNAWRENLEHRLRSGELHPSLEGHLSKYRKLVPALALLFHVIDVGNGLVDVASVRRALDWAAYLEPHAVRVFAAATLAHNTGARLILRRIERGELPAEFTARQVQRRGWSGLTDKEAVAAALDVLVDCNVLREAFSQTGGRPSTVFRVNPKVLKS
jgi:hypothetical protein